MYNWSDENQEVIDNMNLKTTISDESHPETGIVIVTATSTEAVILRGTARRAFESCLEIDNNEQYNQLQKFTSDLHCKLMSIPLTIAFPFCLRQALIDKLLDLDLEKDFFAVIPEWNVPDNLRIETWRSALIKFNGGLGLKQSMQEAETEVKNIKVVNVRTEPVKTVEI